MIRVCVVAPPDDGRCGIGKYARFLADEIKKVGDIELLSVNVLPIRGTLGLARAISSVVGLNPDVVHVHFDYPFFGSHGWMFPMFVMGVKTLSLLRRGRCPRLILSLHEFVSEREVTSTKGKLYHRTFNSFLARHNDVVVALSPTTHRELLSSDSFAKYREKIYVVPHGSKRIGKGNPVLFERKFRLKGFKRRGDFVIGMLGFICREKGHDVLLKALRELGKRVKLVVAGRPRLAEHQPYYEELVDYCRKHLGDSVKFIGFIEDEDIPSFFKYVDALVLPYRRVRQSGILNLALAHGVPVIASNIPEFAKINRKYKCLLLFESENSLDLASKIELMARSETLRKTLGRNAKIYYNDNSLARVSRIYMHLYRMTHSRITNFDLYGNKKQRERIDLLKKLVNILYEKYKKKPLRVLEVGCGSGYVLSKVRGDVKVGLDIDKDRLEFAVNYYKIRGKVGDARRLPFKDNAFDITLVPEILEHLEYEDAVLAAKEAVRVTRGCVIITLPNASKSGYDKNLVENPEHLWLPTYENVFKFVTKVNNLVDKEIEFIIMETKSRDFIFLLLFNEFSSPQRNVHEMLEQLVPPAEYVGSKSCHRALRGCTIRSCCSI